MPVDPDAPVSGSESSDTMQGTDGADTLYGLGGDDSLVGDLGNDSLVGGNGDDTLRGGYGDDTLEGGDGDDEIEGLYGNDVIDTGAGNDHVFGRDGDDLIYGREGDDHLIGSIGTDTVYGGSGNDTLAGSQGNDEIHGGDGNDLAFIGRFEDSDRIFMDAGNDFVDGASAGSSFYAEGGSGNDRMYSGVGDDTLLGGSGNDTLSGGSGNDTLSGGGDHDVVSGGDGDDLFMVQDVPGSLLITDFCANGAADLIDLSALAGYDTVDAVSENMTFGPFQSTLNLDVTGGTLVITIQHETPLTAADLGLVGTLTGTDTGEGPAEFGGDDDDDETGGGDPVDPDPDTDPDSDPDTGGGTGGDGTVYTLVGADAGVFVVDATTGDLSYQNWFTPNYDDVWDMDRDHIYEVSVVGTDANGAEVSQRHLELVVSETGDAVWQDAVTPDDPDGEGGDGDTDGGGPGDETYAGENAEGVSYSLTGDDASIFVIDAETGDVSYQNWFTPNYDEVWDMDRDHVYEVSVVGTDANGDEVSRQAIELVVSETGDAVWQDAVTPDDPDGEGGDGDTDGGGPGDETYAGENAEGVSYSLTGDDASIFVIDAETGDVSYQNWFTPNYDEVWDMDRDHVYEVSVVGTDANGDEVSRQAIELVVSETGDAVWQDAVTPDDPDGEGGDGDTDGGGPGDETYAGENAEGVSYSLTGDDASIFVIDAETGDVSYQNWFTPNYDEVWDMDRDHVYEVSVVGTDANGDEVSRQAIELVVSETGDAVWQDAVTPDDPDGEGGDGDTDGGGPGDETYAGENAEGVSYSLTGDDASIFVIDADTGDVSYQNWFTPNYDDVWDMDRDHIYEVSVVGMDANGDEVSRQAIELVVSDTDEAVWQDAGSVPGDPEELTGSAGTAAYLNGAADGDLLDTFDAAADLYIDGQGDGTAPIFDGSIDWHSSVHAHLANVAAFEASGDQAGLQAFADARFAAEDVQGEIDLNIDDPYGWAWLLKLDTKLQDNGIDNLAPAGEHFAAELEADLATQIANGSTDNGEGSYNDANWKIANLIQYAQHQGDTDAEARYLEMFDDIQADTDVTGDTSIADGDFFSSLSLSAYAHVVAGSTDTAQFQDIHDQMLESVTDGSLDALLDTEGARLDAGIGFSHSAGVAISSGYGYWALFEETHNPAFYDAYANVMEWTETYGAEMAESIAPGHWLPNFASFAADLPDQMPVEDPDGSLTAQIEDWQANDATPITTNDATDPAEPTDLDVEDQILTGGSGDDVLTGAAGDDVLDGLGGKDTLDAGAGDDTLLAGFDDGTGDVFIGGPGDDTYDIANSSVSNFDFNVDLAEGSDAYGNSLDGIENILGGSGNDTLAGDAEDNLLDGGDGDDVLVASAGDDVLTGGAGNDTFAVTAEAGALQITDFGFNGEADQIDVSTLGSVFADPEQLMAALSFADGVTSFNIDLGDESRLVTIQSDEELEEENFMF